MNQLCKVCGEPAAGYHFGAFTCEGCKSFFGRTYNNISSIGECKNNGKCVINKKNRTACKSCRLRKCLMVGMSKSGSRYGRRSNWFKIHCLLQQQQQPQVQHHSFMQPLQTQHHNVNVNLAAAVGLLQPNAFLPPFRSPAAAASAISVASAARDATSNSESDSGASSADPEDDVRSTSALSYLKPSTSPLSDRMSSDTESFSKNRLFHNNNNNNNSSSNNNNNSKPFISIDHHRVPLPRQPSLSPASFPSASPNNNNLVQSNALVVPNHRWLPSAFPIIGDPATWREFWLRGQPTVAAPAPDQDEPIDLSMKPPVKKIKSEEDEATETKDKTEKQQTSKDLKETDDGECKVGVPLDLTLSER